MQNEEQYPVFEVPWRQLQMSAFVSDFVHAAPIDLIGGVTP